LFFMGFCTHPLVRYWTFISIFPTQSTSSHHRSTWTRLFLSTHQCDDYPRQTKFPVRGTGVMFVFTVLAFGCGTCRSAAGGFLGFIRDLFMHVAQFKKEPQFWHPVRHAVPFRNELFSGPHTSCFFFSGLKISFLLVQPCSE